MLLGGEADIRERPILSNTVEKLLDYFVCVAF